MDQQQISQFINQSLATANNYIHTDRPNKAIELISVAQRVEPENPLVPELFRLIASKNGLCEEPDLTEHFGKIWGGENLDGCTIEVFCDQGMGDVINMLRYIDLMKMYWNCKVVLNCYAYYEELEFLINFCVIDQQKCVDQFVKHHVKCDYWTNIFSIPALLHGIKLDVYYPAHFDLIMQKPIPKQRQLITCDSMSSVYYYYQDKGGFREKVGVGVAWQSNQKNVLSAIKSIPLDVIRGLVSDQYELYSLDPVECPDFMKQIPIRNLYDTAAIITDMDYVVSVDTVSLHLAGAIDLCPSFGLIPDDCDPRWGTQEKTPWYPSMTLVRQEGDWAQAVSKVKEAIESLIQIK